MRDNKRFQQVVIWLVVVGMVLSMVVGVVAILSA